MGRQLTGSNFSFDNFLWGGCIDRSAGARDPTPPPENPGGKGWRFRRGHQSGGPDPPLSYIPYISSPGNCFSAQHSLTCPQKGLSGILWSLCGYSFVWRLPGGGGEAWYRTFLKTLRCQPCCMLFIPMQETWKYFFIPCRNLSHPEEGTPFPSVHSGCAAARNAFLGFRCIAWRILQLHPANFQNPLKILLKIF